MAKLIVVGGGLFGRLAADVAHEAGHSVTVIDRHEPEAGSRAAGCLFKPSWMAGVDWYDEVVAHLARRYTMRDVPMKVPGAGPLGRLTLQHVAPSTILRGPERTTYDLVTGNVLEIQKNGVRYLPEGEDRPKRIQGWVYVATGVWAAELTPDVRVTPRIGLSLLAAKSMPYGKLNVWAPYKQAIAFEIQPGVTWYGDGTTIKPENWDDQRDRDYDRRAVRLLKDRKAVGTARRIYGLRPMAPKEGKAGIYRRVSRNVFVGNGGGKSGTLLGMHFARRLAEDMS